MTVDPSHPGSRIALDFVHPRGSAWRTASGEVGTERTHDHSASSMRPTRRSSTAMRSSLACRSTDRGSPNLRYNAASGAGSAVNRGQLSQHLPLPDDRPRSPIRGVASLLPRALTSAPWQPQRDSNPTAATLRGSSVPSAPCCLLPFGQLTCSCAIRLVFANSHSCRAVGCNEGCNGTPRMRFAGWSIHPARAPQASTSCTCT